MARPYIYARADQLGIPVLDAVLPVKITVTDEDVLRAKRADSKHCALARAAIRIPRVLAAYFFRSCAFLEFEDKVLRFALPPSVQKEIVSFDRARVFASGVYQISPPAPTNRAGQSAKRTRALRARKVAQRRFDAEVASVVGRPVKAVAVGARTVAGIRSPSAPTPLSGESPKKRHVHHTQYVRDLKEPL